MEYNHITPNLRELILTWKLKGHSDKRVLDYAMIIAQSEIQQAIIESQKVINASERITE